MTAPYPLLQSPLPGYIEPKGSSVSGGRQVVISTLADHTATGRGKGTDIAPYPVLAGQPVRLMRAGVMYQSYRQPFHNPPQIGDGSLIRRFKHAEGNTGYAHLASFSSLVLGRLYPAGTIVGYQGNSGTSKVHLHTHWQDNAGVHREVYLQMEQSRNLQCNSNVEGVRLRTAPGLSGSIWGSIGAAGIVRADGKRIADRSAILPRRHVVHVNANGYTWMPVSVSSTALWIARPFIHFV